MAFFHYTNTAVLRYLYLGPTSAMYNEVYAWSQSILTMLQVPNYIWAVFLLK